MIYVYRQAWNLIIDSFIIVVFMTCLDIFRYAVSAIENFNFASMSHYLALERFKFFGKNKKKHGISGHLGLF